MRSMRRVRLILVFIAGLFNVLCSPGCSSPPEKRCVILISIDGLRSDAITNLGPRRVPYLYRMIREGAATLNARTDADFAVTLPNHACMLTGRGVNGSAGHGYRFNDDPGGQTIHEIKGKYVASVFDVLSRYHLRCAFFASKEKFELYLQSYGAQSTPGQLEYVYQGQRFIDRYLVANDDEVVVLAALQELRENQPAFVFLHISETDKIGHQQGWDLKTGSAYLAEVEKVDHMVGEIMRAVQETPALSFATTIIVTSDHGGHGYSHGDAQDWRDNTIPFLVWGAGAAQGMDLYALNPATRADPGTSQVPYSAGHQPVRNGDAGNLALQILGLPAISGSTINRRQDLRITVPVGKMSGRID